MSYITINNANNSILLPTENGKYTLNVNNNSYMFEKERSVIQQAWIFKGTSSVMKNLSFAFNNIPKGKYLLILDTNVYNRISPVQTPASIGFSEKDIFFSVTEMQGVQSSHIVGMHILDVDNTRMFTINVKAKNMEGYIYNNFDIKLIPL